MDWRLIKRIVRKRGEAGNIKRKREEQQQDKSREETDADRTLQVQE